MLLLLSAFLACQSYLLGAHNGSAATSMVVRRCDWGILGAVSGFLVLYLGATGVHSLL